jgi:hypothetical protein
MARTTICESALGAVPFLAVAYDFAHLAAFRGRVSSPTHTAQNQFPFAESIGG